MTDTAIKDQIRYMKSASTDATKSKESAIKFLQDAGLLAKTTAKSSNKSNSKVTQPKKK